MSYYASIYKYILIYTNIHKYIITLLLLSRASAGTLISNNSIIMYWCIFVYIGIYWYMLVYIGLYLCILIYIDKNILAHIRTY